MKKLSTAFLLLTILVCCTACDRHDNHSNNSLVPYSKDTSDTSNNSTDETSNAVIKSEPVVRHENPRVDFTKEEVREIIEQYSNINVSDDYFYASVPKKIDHVSEFYNSTSFQLPPQENYDEYKRIFEYLFPGHELDMTCLYYNSHMDDNDEADHKLSDENNLEAFLNGKYEQSRYMRFLYYDECENLKENSVSMYYRSPFGNDYCVFNKGVCNKFTAGLRGEDKYYAYEQFRLNDPDFNFEYVGSYPPDSEAAFKLLDDKEITIKDAVSFFEHYIASIPSAEQPVFGIHVNTAYVYRLDEEHYGFEFINSRIYDGIHFNYTWDDCTIDGINRDMSYGIMVKSDDVDHVYAPFNAYKAYDEVKHTDIVPFKDAVKTVSEKMTDYVGFEVTRAELLFRQKPNAGESDQVGETRYPTYPSWKLTMRNPNDNLTYVAYVNALTGEFEGGR